MSELDTREKLEEDVYRFCKNNSDELGVIKGFLVRQAAITRLEFEDEIESEHADLYSEKAEAQTEYWEHRVGELEDNVRELTEERDRLQATVDEERLSYLMAFARAEKAEDALADVEHTHMRLPVDMDGVPIQIGDSVKQINHAGAWTDAMPVVAVDEKGCFALASGIACSARTYVWGNNCRHVKQDTVESLLDGFIKEAVDILSTNHDVDWYELGKLVLKVNSDMRDEYAERIRRACNG